MHSLPCPDRNPACDPDAHPKPAPAGADLTHPAWCDSRSCRARRGGPHRGPAVLVDVDHIGSASLQMRLWSPTDDPDDPVALLELTATNRDSRQSLRVDLSMNQLDQLRGLLTNITGHVSGQ
ncbi:MAG TPA: hypothetical protein VFW21_11620 [Mycobacterium sp.]|nr:hypothetical protein [Mycobacterium sp.]